MWPAFAYLGRTVAGILMAGVFSMAGIAIAWGIFLFFGFQSAGIWFVLLLCSAGAGAGFGGFLAWLRIDDRHAGLALLTVVAGVAAGVGGAWLGYEYGAYRSALCCDRSGATIAFSPATYSAFGAAILANVAMLTFGLVRDRFGGILLKAN
ncbi:MAG: hypothetical protein BZY88_03040 [SAR202 cluster bacterium Io17-Chloro-G9]|nr:MAG: hypothetical protein BZY88_03040 [SAR202 cluster bacterium Io17-Chloro-G9]